MKMQLLPELSVRARLENLLDILIERIIDITDYLCEIKRVTLSEWAAFLSNAGFTFSFVFYNVKGSSPVFDYIWNEAMWTAVFVLLFLCHVIGFYKNSVLTRYFVAVGYSMNWFVWSVITFYGQPHSPAWTVCATQMLVSIVLAVRLKDESNSYYVTD